MSEEPNTQPAMPLEEQRKASQTEIGALEGGKNYQKQGL